MPISSPNSAARIRLPHPLLPSSLQRNSRNSPLILHRNLLPTLFLHPFSRLRCSQTVSSATVENCSVEFESMDLEKKYAWELEVAVKAVHMTALLCRRARSPNLRKINPRVPFQEAFYLYSSSFTFFKGFSLSNFTPPQLASMATEELIKSPSLPLYPQMGGCEEGPNTCTNKTCHGHEVDIPHFSLGNAIPGRLYGRNPVDNRQGYGGDRYGHLVDLYGWNPHCRYLDGLGPSENDTTAQNDWQGSWWHSSLTDHSGFIKEDSPYTSAGQKGTYYFEFSRPLRTKDHLQQDAQFTIGKKSKVSAAFWYPEEGKPWHGSAHYSISCDRILLDFVPAGSSELTSAAQGSSWDFATTFSLFFSVVALCLSISPPSISKTGRPRGRPRKVNQQPFTGVEA